MRYANTGGSVFTRALVDTQKKSSMNKNGKVNQYFLNIVWLVAIILPNRGSNRESKRGPWK